MLTFTSGMVCIALAKVEKIVVMTVRSERGLEAEARRANTSFRVLEHQECGCEAGGGGAGSGQQRRQGGGGACVGAGCDQARGSGCQARWAHTLHLVMFTALGKHQIVDMLVTFKSWDLFIRCGYCADCDTFVLLLLLLEESS